jgi:quercetin dioxygenase-like cupin family protein
MRRVIAGLSPQGRSTVLLDGPAAEWFRVERTPGRYTMAPLDGPPAAVEPGGTVLGKAFPVEGLVLPTAAELDPGGATVSLPVEGPFRTGFVCFGPEMTSRMHHTASYDVSVVVAGRVELLLEETSVPLGAGDVAIIPGVEHAWRTPADTGVTLVATVVPLGQGSELSGS